MSPQDVIEGYLAALRHGDLAAVVALYAQDASIEDPVGSEPIVGHDAIREFYRAAIGSITEASLSGQIRVAGCEAAFPFEIGMNYNGHKMAMSIIDTFVFNSEGKVVKMRAYWSEANMRPA